MPLLTNRICGVCPEAHHMAATKALDDLYKVEPTVAGRKIRELVYNTFMLEDNPSLRAFVERMTRINKGRALYTRPDHLGDEVADRSGAEDGDVLLHWPGTSLRATRWSNFSTLTTTM